MTLKRTSELPARAERVWAAIHDPAVMVRVLAPLIAVRPIEPRIFPERFDEATYVVGLKAFGALPLGRQAVNLTHPAPEPGEPLPRYVLHDKGSGDLARVWNQRIVVSPLSDTTCRYADELIVEAGWLTPLVALWARILLRHKHRRLRALAATGSM